MVVQRSFKCLTCLSSSYFRKSQTIFPKILGINRRYFLTTPLSPNDIISTTNPQNTTLVSDGSDIVTEQVLQCRKHELLTQSNIEDSVMGILSRYVANPVKDIELTTKMESLEALTGHEIPSTNFLTSQLENNNDTPRRHWDCLDTVEFLLDIETLFNIRIPDSIADAVSTPTDAVNAVIQILQKEGRMVDRNTH